MTDLSKTIEDIKVIEASGGPKYTQPHCRHSRCESNAIISYAIDAMAWCKCFYRVDCKDSGEWGRLVEWQKIVMHNTLDGGVEGVEQNHETKLDSFIALISAVAARLGEG